MDNVSCTALCLFTTASNSRTKLLVQPFCIGLGGVWELLLSSILALEALVLDVLT